MKFHSTLIINAKNKKLIIIVYAKIFKKTVNVRFKTVNFYNTYLYFIFKRGKKNFFLSIDFFTPVSLL